MMMKSSMAATVVALLLYVPAHAGFISTVTKTGGNGEVPVVVDLTEGVLAYTDRTHTLVNIPDGLLDNAETSQLVQLSNSDKTNAPLQHDITFDRLSVIYVGLDDRLSAQPLSWMNDTVATGLPDGFFDTGAQIDIDEGGDGSIEQTFSMWVSLAPAGTYSFYEQDDGGSRNMYFVAAADQVLVPEPSCLVLALLGVVGLVGCRRKR
jgi:hypothetical protein